MDREKTKSEIIGEHIKRERMKRNLTQEQLAEAVNVAKNTVSGWEKSLSDIEKISMLERFFGCDLQKEDYDAEGVVGEVGKEILKTLVNKAGYISFAELHKDYMYGMSEARVAAEVIKIANIGACVREQFLDFEGESRDIVFITAKGLITYKNVFSNLDAEKELSERIKRVKTYEMLLSGDSHLGIPDASCFEQYIEMRPVEKIVRKLFSLIEKTPYKINYRIWLARRYEKGFERSLIFEPEKGDTLTPACSFYLDTILKMTWNVNTSNVAKMLSEYNDICSDMSKKWLNDDIYLQNKQLSDAKRRGNLEKKLHNAVYVNETTTFMLPWVSEPLIEESNEFFATEQEKAEKLYLEEQEARNVSNYCRTRYYQKQEELGTNSCYIEDWYETSEIKKYISDDLMYKDEYVQEIDALIKELHAIDPKSKQYYEIPEIYDNDGLGEFVKKAYILQ